MNNILEFKTLTVRNFLSFGSYDTTLDLQGNGITGIVGLNIDTGGEDSRNGAGKSSLGDAISFNLFGKTPRGISNNKLRHKFARAGQGLSVILEFSIKGFDYLIERGESPSKLLLFKKPVDTDEDFRVKEGRTMKYNISRSSKIETTNEIIKIVGFDFVLFEYLIGNSADSTPFLKLSEEKRREVSESLLGFSILTERADKLKDQRKDIKKDLISVESAYNATVDANNRISAQLRELDLKQKRWNTSHNNDLDDLDAEIEALNESDPDADIAQYKILEELKPKRKDLEHQYDTLEIELNTMQRQRRTDKRELDRIIDDIADTKHKMTHAESSTCPTCGQDWKTEEVNVEALQESVTELTKKSKELENSVDTADSEAVIQLQLDELTAKIGTVMDEMSEANTYNFVYSDIESAMGAEAKLEALLSKLEDLKNTENPYDDTIEGLETNAIKDVDDTEIREKKLLVEHYDFLISLLRDKDSFIRKEIIKIGLPELNRRMHHHLQVLGLSHSVRFNNELAIDITLFDEEYEYGNLSKGERQRLNMAINFSFQDIFEFLNYRLSLLMVDEMVDSGIDSRGARNALSDLKTNSMEKGKKVFLVTHRDDILSQVDDIITIQKQNEESHIIHGMV